MTDAFWTNEWTNNSNGKTVLWSLNMNKWLLASKYSNLAISTLWYLPLLHAAKCMYTFRVWEVVFNPILYGLFFIRQKTPPPPWLKLEKWLKLGKRHFLAKIDCCCPLFMHLELNYYHFWPKKGQKNWRRRGSNRGIEGSPLWIVCGKNCRRKIFWIFQKEIPKMAYPGPF